MRTTQLFLLPLLAFCVQHASVFSQTVETAKIINILNTKIQATENGTFDVKIKFKSAPIEDTATFSGSIYFFKNQPDRHGLGHFALIDADGLNCVYDGTFFYNFNHKDKVIRLTASDQYNPMDLIEGNLFQSLSLFPPYLRVRKPAFDPTAFELFSPDIIPQSGHNNVRLAYQESFANDFKLSPNDPDTSRYVINYEISQPDHTLRSISEWQYFMQTPQYQRIEFSPIRPLTADSTLNKIVQWVALFDSGYHVEYYNPGAEAEMPNTSFLSVGDDFPDFALPDLNGTTVRSTNLREGILLIDFWYRACAPCLKAMPSIETLHQNYEKKGLTVLGINPFDQDAEKLHAFLSARQVNYRTLLDSNRTLTEQLGINAYPTLLLVDAYTKKILHVETGFGAESETALAKLIEGYLLK